jgi:hypothetical protein
MISEIWGPRRLTGRCVEDLAVEPEGDDALLDARAAGVVDADHRAAGLERVVHDLDDLLAEDLAEGAAEDREVLGEDTHRSAVDRAVAGDDPVAVRPVALQAEGRGAVPGELVELDERAVVEKRLDALAGGLLALRVLLLHGARGPGVDRLVVAPLQVGELAGGGVQVDGVGSGTPRAVCCRFGGHWLLLPDGRLVA